MFQVEICVSTGWSTSPPQREMEINTRLEIMQREEGKAIVGVYWIQDAWMIQYITGYTPAPSIGQSYTGDIFDESTWEQQNNNEEQPW